MALRTDEPRLRVDEQTIDGEIGEAVRPPVRVHETVLADVAVGLDLPQDVIPNVGAGHAPTIELLRQLAVHLRPRLADARLQKALQRVDQV